VKLSRAGFVEQTGRISSHNSSFRHILGHNGTGSNDRPTSDFNTEEYKGIRGDPGMVSDLNRTRHRRPGRIKHLMACREDLDPVIDANIRSNRQ
jgi:hypothetical protein